jgi:hypothetical protein
MSLLHQSIFNNIKSLRAPEGAFPQPSILTENSFATMSTPNPTISAEYDSILQGKFPCSACARTTRILMELCTYHVLFATFQHLFPVFTSNLALPLYIQA